MRKHLALAAAAVLTVLSLGATSTAAQADEVGASQAGPYLNEVLINTTGFNGVEVINPSANADPTANIDGYSLIACDSAGTATVLVSSISSSAGDTLVTASNRAGEDVLFTNDMTIDHRSGGVALRNPSGVTVDAVTFDAVNASVATCLGGAALVSDSPTATLSAQRRCDVGPWVLAPPTFGGSNYCR